VRLDSGKTGRGEGTEPGLTIGSVAVKNKAGEEAYHITSGAARDPSKVGVCVRDIGVCRVSRGGDQRLACRSAAGIANRTAGKSAPIMVGRAFERSKRATDAELVRLRIGSHSGKLAGSIDVLEDVAGRELGVECWHR
jgi:hypothetical protein